MYNLGEHFKVDYEKIMPNPECIFQGKNYRFTLLSERLIRIEYRESGIFHDQPTELVRNRNFSKPEFTVKQDKNYLELTTSYFKLFYAKGHKINNSKNSSNKSHYNFYLNYFLYLVF